MSKYTKTPKVEVDDVDNENLDGRNYRIPNERTRTGPMPYDIPDQLKEVEVKEENKPSNVNTTTAIVNPKDTSRGDTDIPTTSSETREQAREQIKGSSEDDQFIANENPITLVTEPCQPPSNRRSTQDNLQNEYLNDVPELLRLVNKKEKRTRNLQWPLNILHCHLSQVPQRNSL